MTRMGTAATRLTAAAPYGRASRVGSACQALVSDFSALAALQSTWSAPRCLPRAPPETARATRRWRPQQLTRPFAPQFARARRPGSPPAAAAPLSPWRARPSLGQKASQAEPPPCASLFPSCVCACAQWRRGVLAARALLRSGNCTQRWSCKLITRGEEHFTSSFFFFFSIWPFLLARFWCFVTRSSAGTACLLPPIAPPVR